MKWECIDDDTSRLKVRGGWIYRIRYKEVDTSTHLHQNCIFIPEIIIGSTLCQ